MTSSVLLLLLLGGLPRSADEPAPLPPPRVSLRLEAPDAVGPWKMIVTNEGDIPVRLAADGRLMSLEVEPPEDADTEPNAEKKKKTRRGPVVCKLPQELRPSTVVENRAVLLPPGARYEEVVSPVLYCFGEAEAKALVPGAMVTAKLGFPEAPQNGRAKTPSKPPFIVEPAMKQPTVAPVKELVDRFVIRSHSSAVSTPASAEVNENDPNAPQIELTAPARVDGFDERTVTMSFTIKNAGGRAVSLHIRRDNLMFDIDGPSGSAHCGQPAVFRRVPREMHESLGPGGSRKIDVWVGELCPHTVFDRPGLYRVWPSLAFPSAGGPDSLLRWTKTVSANEPVLVRIRKGNLPFYASPPQVFGASP